MQYSSLSARLVVAWTRNREGLFYFLEPNHAAVCNPGVGLRVNTIGNVLGAVSLFAVSWNRPLSVEMVVW